MNSNLYIPNKIRIGFRQHSETSRKIAYITFFDEKGKLRNENSWKEWRDDSIPYIELDNNPVEGFIFDKDFEQEEVLNYNPFLLITHQNKFEFTISTSNLFLLLLRANISKKSINSKCVYAFDTYNNLILLPVDSLEYENAINYTETVNKKFSTKELQKGFKYSLKRSDEVLTYLGYFDFFKYSYIDFRYLAINKNLIKNSKKHVFYDKNGNFLTPSISTLLISNSSLIDTDYQKNLDTFLKSKYSRKLNTLFIDEPIININEKGYDSIYKNYGKEIMYKIDFDYDKTENISFDKDRKFISGLNFYIYELTSNDYKRKNYKTITTSPEEIKEFLSIFPEIAEKPVSLENFSIMVRENGFKSVYLRTDVKDSIKYRL